MAKLKCEIELDKAGGITITVEDPQGRRTQMVHLDGVKITLKVKGQGGTSTVVQEEDKVRVEAKEFEVDAQKITLRAKTSVLIDSKSTVTVKSLKNMTLDAKGNLTAKALKTVKIDGMSVVAKGKTKAEVSAMQVNIKGKAKATLAAPMVDVNAKAVAKLQGAIVQTKAKAILTAQSNGITNVKGSLTNIQGMLVKLG